MVNKDQARSKDQAITVRPGDKSLKQECGRNVSPI